MRLTFLGTRAHIAAASRRHRRHSAALLDRGAGRVMVDCGADWQGRLGRIAPDAIVLTHAHPDHAFGLAEGAPCPVYATPETLAHIADFPLADRRTIAARAPLTLAGMRIEAFEVAHSTRCPAVGFRISTEGAAIFYVPDVAHIPQRDAALAGCGLFVGDGASLEDSLVRPAGDTIVGHAPVRQQLTWCRKTGVPAALFTHCGTEVVAGDGRTAAGKLRHFANARGVAARFAYDGMTRDVPETPGGGGALRCSIAHAGSPAPGGDPRPGPSMPRFPARG